MKPFHTLARVRTPDGTELTLHEHDGEHFLKLNGRQLMSTTSTVSERQLAELGCADSPRRAGPARVLIGGLGFGFTLKRVLELLGPTATVQVAELLPEVVTWNREFLGKVNGALLDDPRVQTLAVDVYDLIAQAPPASFDAILLDVDNGSDALVQKKNSRLYDWRGLARLRRALRGDGKAAFWSAGEDKVFARHLVSAGFHVSAFEAKAHERARQSHHRIYVAQPSLQRASDRPASDSRRPGATKPGSRPPSRTRPPERRKAPHRGSAS